MKHTHLDLFSGIGGFAIAAQNAGFETIGFSEIEPYACAVLNKHWPNVKNHGDIKSINGIKADLVTGGFPCQPYSVAGKRKGAADDRALWPEMLRVIAEARPAWIVGENVAGIINMELDRVLSDLEALGYATWPLVIPACATDARHRRDRVWIVAHSMRGRHTGSRKPVNAVYPEEKEIWKATKSGNGCRPAQWSPEPRLGRVAHGVPNRSYRLQGLGNAIVPQVAEVILREIAKLMP
jgi:DNA (cytosine-5)-methyltransferase 1